MPDTADLSAAFTPVSTAVGTAALSTPIVATMNKDGADYYSFVTTYNSNQIWRYSYGSSPMNSPTVTVLGTFGLTSGVTEDIFVVRDGANWFGFVVSGSNLLRLEFGTSLSNTPTSTLMSYPSNLSWPHQLVIKNWNGAWYGFVANRNGDFTRLDFGAALTATPTATNLPNVGGVANPCNFVLHEEGGQWYALITSLISGTLTRYSFGTNLANNTPTGVNLGTFGVFTIPRGVILFDDCNQLTGVVVNENAQMFRLDFANSVLNTPTVTSLGNIAGSFVVNSTTSFTHNDTVYLMCPGGSEVRRIPHLALPAATEHVYYNNTISLSFPAAGTYNLGVTTDQGYGTGAKAHCKQVVVVPGSGGTLALQDSLIGCRMVRFTASGTFTGQVQWNFGDGSTGTGNPVIHQYVGAGPYTVTASSSVSGGSGCAGTAAGMLIVTLPTDPVVTISGNPSICTGASTPLTAAGATSYVWSPATGLNTATGSSVVASPTVATIYTVTGTTTLGCTGTATHSLTVNPIPTVTANSSPGTICEGAVATLTAAASIPATFSWTPGGATQGITQVSPTATAVYTVTATAAGCSATDTALVTVLAKPVVSITTPDATVCPQSTATLTASAGGTAGTLVWAAPASGATATITTPAITSPTTFSVYFTAANGCRDTAAQAIGVHPLPTVAVNGPALLCSGTGPASLTATGATSYLWSPAQYLNTTSGATVQSLPLVGTSSTYTVTGTDANGCIGTDQHTLSVQQSPIVNAGPDTAVCSGNPLTLFASGAASIVWNPTNSTAAGDSITILETVLANTTYSYIATGTVGACSDADTVKLTVRALPAVTTLPKLAFVCRYDSARLSATGASTYAWSPIAGLANPAAGITMAKPETATTYIVTGTDAFGCVNRDTTRVNVNEALPVKASGDGQPISCDNSLAQLHATGATSYVWSPGQYLNDSTMAHPVATPPTTTQFTVIGSNSAGCTGRDTITVVSLRESTLMMPNVFTPNSDGLNDRVYPLVYCDFTFRSFSIYNRWGQCVFTSTKQEQGWDGRFKGEPADVGVYMFMVQGTGDSGSAKTLTGNITLLR